MDIQLTVNAKENTTAKVYVAFVDEKGRLQASGVSADTTLMNNTPADISASIIVPENAKGDLLIFIWVGVDTLKPLYEKITVF